MKKITDGDCVPVMLGTWAWGDKLSFGGEYPKEELSGLGVLKRIRCEALEDSYLRLRYQVIR